MGGFVERVGNKAAAGGFQGAVVVAAADVPGGQTVAAAFERGAQPRPCGALPLVEQAYRRIYFAPQDTWGGEWQLVLIPGSLAGAPRDQLRKELAWAGYGALASGILAHPSADTEALLDILQETGAHDKVVAMRAANISALTSKPLQELVHECWNLDVLAAKYTDFIECFRPVLRTLRAAGDLDPEQCFLVQTLLMHDFRRALLHDPQLPVQLLPVNWSGGVARQLCRDIYSITWPHAQRHLLAVCETASGPLPPPATYFLERFGGLAVAGASPALATA